MAHRLFEYQDLSEKYKQYRPRPPQILIDRVLEYLKEKFTGELELAVDVGCGTGQNTYYYADIFKKVVGTDVSPTQIAATSKDNTRSNVSFEVCPAENLTVPDNSVQLLMAVTAIHWFDHPKFFAEGLRVLVPGGVLAVYGYSTLIYEWDRNPARNDTIRAAVDEYVQNGPISKYWAEPFRKYVLHNCRNIVIPDTYEDRLRDDDTYFSTRPISLTGVIQAFQTWSAFGTYRAAVGPEEAEKMLQGMQNKLLSIIQPDLTPDENDPGQIIFTERTPYYLMLARKPSN